ncbi:GNAT family N-acetyltransferase [Haloplanus halobius]|uniref:GNAT family N-acetyltransferase n=1 Tax=Haloplanus halobius TaxID=2934938 RepID=UPI00200D4E82|nr:GNAT family N-acetyltransferase [Haloplanus sp. XH21]
MNLAAAVADLRAEARRANERRLLVLAGDRDRGLDAAWDAIAVGDDADATLVTTREGRGDRLHPQHATRLLGRTRDVVVLDAHEGFSANALGRVVGAVDGGGLFVLVTPSLDDWPDRRTDADERLAVPPFTVDDVTGHFRRRLVETLRTHPGVAIADVDDGVLERDGLTDPPPARPRPAVAVPVDAAFPREAYEACLTPDQADAVAALERLREPGSAVVVEADRGRGKSAAAGLAAGSLAAEGRDVLVTAPAYRNAAEVCDRASALLEALGVHDGRDDEAHVLRATSGGQVRFCDPEAATDLPDDPDAVIVDEAAALPVRRLAALLNAPATAFVTTVHGYEGAGRGFDVRFRDRLAESDRDVTDARLDDPIRYAAGDPVEVWAFRALLLDARPAVDQVVADATPADATYRALDAETLLADEHLLRETFGLLVLAHYQTEPDDLARLLDARPAVDQVVADATPADATYRALDAETLLADEHLLRETFGLLVLAHYQTEPDDLARLLDARPAVDQVVADATPADATYRALDAETLLADEHLLRETFGLLVLAHYQTEPDDLARLLDAPNLRCRALLIDGHVAAVALLAREGGLPESLRTEMYEGARVRGNMLPDVLTSQLRDLAAGAPVGYRVLRIATHHALRSSGFGSRLLDACHDEFDDAVDWFGVGYGATPRLVRFWERNGYRTVHCSTTRNASSGEYSAVMLRPTSADGQALHDRHARRFKRRMRDGLCDALRDLAPDVARAVLRATGEAGTASPTLSDHEWRVVAAAAFGPGLYDAAPGAFRDLALAHLTDPVADLSTDAERLLVRKPLQAHTWERVAADLDYVSTRQCMQALGDAMRPLVERYGTDTAQKERRRYDDSND